MTQKMNSCPNHPQSNVWNSESGPRCAVGGELLDGTTPPATDNIIVRNLDTYQKLAGRTHFAKGGPRTKDHLTIDALGIAGEAGEVADYVKKIIAHGHPMDKDKFCKELGDCLWYVSQCAEDVGLTLSEVATANVAKLKARYPEGFSAAASIARVDTQNTKDFHSANDAQFRAAVAEVIENK